VRLSVRYGTHTVYCNTEHHTLWTVQCYLRSTGAAPRMRVDCCKVMCPCFCVRGRFCFSRCTRTTPMASSASSHRLSCSNEY